MRLSHNGREHVRSGFTLVELLVVIGIIALLISILLPALNKAREQAKLISCANNMRQVGQAFFMYAAQSQGWLPPAVSAGWYGPYYPNGTTSMTWMDYMVQTGCLKAGNGPFTGALAWLNAYWIPVMRCPSAQSIAGTGDWGSNWLQMWSYDVPYNIFGVDSGTYPGLPRPSKLASLRPAPQVVILVESLGGSPSYLPFVESSEGRSTWNPGMWGWDVRHGNRSNFLMADGHVKSYAFHGKKVYGVQWCFLNQWDKEVQDQLYFSRAQIGLPQSW